MWKCCSNAPFTDTSMLVRFFLFLPCAAILSIDVGEPVVESASSSHFCNSGFNLHIFLKLNCNASNLQIVVCENTFPYKVPSARPTSACVKPSLIRRCLNCLANASRSSLVGVSSSPPLTSRSDTCCGWCGLCISRWSTGCWR